MWRNLPDLLNYAALTPSPVGKKTLWFVSSEEGSRYTQLSPIFRSSLCQPVYRRAALCCAPVSVQGDVWLSSYGIRGVINLIQGDFAVQSQHHHIAFSVITGNLFPRSLTQVGKESVVPALVLMENSQRCFCFYPLLNLVLQPCTDSVLSP